MTHPDHQLRTVRRFERDLHRATAQEIAARQARREASRDAQGGELMTRAVQLLRRLGLAR